MLLSIHGLFRFLSRRVSKGAHLLLTVRNTFLYLSHFLESICSGQSVLFMESISNSFFLSSVISKLYFFMCAFFPYHFFFRKDSVDQVMIAKGSIIYSRHNMRVMVIKNNTLIKVDVITIALVG